MKCDLELSLWAIVNGVSRVALNCPIFDSYLNHVGSTPTANRHDLKLEHLMQLNQLVVTEQRARIVPVRSVSIFSDGWRDRVRRNWIDLGVSFTNEMLMGGQKEWSIEVFDTDMLPIPGASTGDVLETLVKESLDEFLPPDCLIATSTNDGAGDERKAAFQLVKDGNDFWCAAHLVQLAIDDCLDNKKAHPPAECAPHRAVLKKAHDLVVYVNSHRIPTQRFEELIASKRTTEEGAKAWEHLVLDNDTRWDTDLMLLERVVYFDAEILALYGDADVDIPHDCILNRDEFDLAFGMALVLEPFRKFTKFVQYRNKITVAHLPRKLDKLLTRITPGRFDQQLVGRSPSILPQLAAFQKHITSSVKRRYSSIFDGSSLALSACYFLPGANVFNFENFQVDEATLHSLQDNLLDDFEVLLPIDTPKDEIAGHRAIAQSMLPLVRKRLNALPADTDPLKWWPQQTTFVPLFPLVKMLFAIPASSADSERSFSSAGFTMGARRSRVDLASFRAEHRIRRFIVAGTDAHSQEGRRLRLERVRVILDRFNNLLGQRANSDNQ